MTKKSENYDLVCHYYDLLFDFYVIILTFYVICHNNEFIIVSKLQSTTAQFSPGVEMGFHNNDYDSCEMIPLLYIWIIVDLFNVK